MLGGLGTAHGSEAGRGVGATGVTPTMGVVVAVPDRRQLDLPPRSLILEVHNPLREWSGHACARASDPRRPCYGISCRPDSRSAWCRRSAVGVALSPNRTDRHPSR